MHRIISRLIVYRNLDKDGILLQLADICHRFYAGEDDIEALKTEIFVQIHRLLDLATIYGFDKNLWHNYLAWLLATTENPFSLTCEKTGAQSGSVNLLARNDFRAFKDLFDYDFSKIEHALQIDCFSIISNYHAIKKDQKKYNKPVSDKVRLLSEAIANAQDEHEIFRIVTEFYEVHGVGKFGMNKVFRIRGTEGNIDLEPITNTTEVSLDDLIGYESQKKALVDNTESFIQGKRANNLLLYGDSGTGKSTCVKAILNAYHSYGLRVIEIYKHQFKDLANVISMIKNRNYRFIIFMDDLSFEDFETEYKYLKAVIEGGMEITPDNVLIYATSNRRHLIKETWSDRNEPASENDIHHTDSAEEKISLVNRFGITIRFDRPSQQEYLAIVKGIAQRYPEITLTDAELIEAAQQWALWHGNRSGRRAQQFINHLLGKGDRQDE
jgi:hypothetical protein